VTEGFDRRDQLVQEFKNIFVFWVNSFCGFEMIESYNLDLLFLQSGESHGA